MMRFLSSKMFSPTLLRYYSTPKAALKLWVKHNGNPATQVSIKECNNIDDFAKNVKQELNIKCQVAIFTSLDKDLLRPGLKIKDLVKSDFKNSDESPLFVRLIPSTQDSIASKTVYVGETDDDGKFTGEYTKYIVQNKEDLRDLYKNGKGLIHLSDPTTAIVSFNVIEDGKKYHVHKYSQDFAGWQKKEADAMEGETLLSMKTFLMNELQASPINLPTDFYDEKGRQIQEWDGILSSGDTRKQSMP